MQSSLEGCRSQRQLRRCSNLPQGRDARDGFRSAPARLSGARTAHGALPRREDLLEVSRDAQLFRLLSGAARVQARLSHDGSATVQRRAARQGICPHAPASAGHADRRPRHHDGGRGARHIVQGARLDHALHASHGPVLARSAVALSEQARSPPHAGKLAGRFAAALDDGSRHSAVAQHRVGIAGHRRAASRGNCCDSERHDGPHRREARRYPRCRRFRAQPGDAG